MHQTKTDRADHLQIDRPVCTQCGSQMWLARVAQDAAGKENRTFECPVCEISIGESCNVERDHRGL